MITIKDLFVDYGDISFRFKDHTFKQVTFITGRNGSGKTTLLKSIAGLLEYEGSVIGEGTYISQEPVVFDRTAYENLIYPLEIRGLNVDDYKNKINDLADKLNIKHLYEKNAKKLSGGEKMKVAFIRGIIFNPKVILLDEPTTHLDIESIEELVQLIKELKEKMTILIVSHNKAFMQELKEQEYYLEL